MSKITGYEQGWENWGDVNHDDYGGLFLKKIGPTEVAWITTDNMEDHLGERDFEGWLEAGGEQYEFDAGTVDIEGIPDDVILKALQTVGRDVNDASLFEIVDALLAYGHINNNNPLSVDSEEYDEVLENWLSNY